MVVGKPTLVNNVETLANIPPSFATAPIVSSSWHSFQPWHKGLHSPGERQCNGLIEVPMGITLREVVSIYAKGMKSGSFKLAQTGGSSGSIIPASLQDTPMDFESYKRAGVSLGSGALLICNDEVCIVDLAKVLLNFFRVESCGKCTPCRIGTKRAYDILTGISQGEGTLEDLDELLSLNKEMLELSNCGLGQTAVRL